MSNITATDLIGASAFIKLDELVQEMCIKQEKKN